MSEFQNCRNGDPKKISEGQNLPFIEVVKIASLKILKISFTASSILFIFLAKHFLMLPKKGLVYKSVYVLSSVTSFINNPLHHFIYFLDVNFLRWMPHCYALLKDYSVSCGHALPFSFSILPVRGFESKTPVLSKNWHPQRTGTSKRELANISEGVWTFPICPSHSLAITH